MFALWVVPAAVFFWFPESGGRRILADLADETQESVRERVLRLLTEMHDVDAKVRVDARNRLRAMGIPEQQLELGSLLKHPDSRQRGLLVERLNEAGEPLRSELRLELTRDADRDVRAAVLNSLNTIDAEELSNRLRERLQEIADTDSDPELRRLAKTLLPSGSRHAVYESAQQDSEATLPAETAAPAHPAPSSTHSPGAAPSPRTGSQDTPLHAPSARASRNAAPGRLRAEKMSSFVREEGEIQLLSQAGDLGVPPAPGAALAPAPGAALAPTPAPGAALNPDSDQDGLSSAANSFDERFRSIGKTAGEDFGTRSPGRRPEILDRPIEPEPVPEPVPELAEVEQLLIPQRDPPRGFTGPSGILPRERQQNSHFVPVPDRWRTGYPRTDRYGLGYPWLSDYIGVPGHWWDPYNQNVLKGDFPIVGQHTFFNLTATSQTLFDYRQVPTGTTPFESTKDANQEEFFGDPNQFFINQNLFVRLDLFHGNTIAFKPIDWQIRVTPAFNFNYLDVNELAIVNPDVRDGTTRFRDHTIFIQEYFGEARLADLSPDYDFVSARVGSQLFNSDFRGFIFFDVNRAVRLFGSKFSNRHQFNLLFFDMVEKDTNSQLNTLRDRHQNVLIANYYVQDFIFPGYTAQASFHWNNDQPSMQFDRNQFLVRPDPVGVFRPHRVESYYFGIAGDGHMGRYNVNNAFYWVTGRDGLNPIGGRELDINAYMAALELSYDRDWVRFRASFFYASGDDNPNDTDGEGFDSIMDNPVFAGGEFSYWQRQAIQLFGVRLVNDRSLVPDLRSSKIQGQSNFTNPGLLLFNVGMDMDITPKFRTIMNANYLMFDETEVLSTFTFQRDIDNEIGLDLSVGFEWRPFHNDNAIMLFGASALIPDEGFKDLYAEFGTGDVDTLFASFFEMVLTY